MSQPETYKSLTFFFFQRQKILVVTLAGVKWVWPDFTCTGRKYAHKCTDYHFVFKNFKLWLLNWKKKGRMTHQIKLSKERTRTAMALSMFSHYFFDLLLTLFWKDINGKRDFDGTVRGKNISYVAKVKMENFLWVA